MNGNILFSIVKVIDLMEKKFESDQKVAPEILAKFNEVFSKNTGFIEVKNLINGNITGVFKKMSPKEREFVLCGPATSSDAERCFSTCKSIFRDNRHRFEIKAFRIHVIKNRYNNGLQVCKM